MITHCICTSLKLNIKKLKFNSNKCVKSVSMQQNSFLLLYSFLGRIMIFSIMCVCVFVWGVGWVTDRLGGVELMTGLLSFKVQIRCSIFNHAHELPHDYVSVLYKTFPSFFICEHYLLPFGFPNQEVRKVQGFPLYLTLSFNIKVLWYSKQWKNSVTSCTLNS